MIQKFTQQFSADKKIEEILDEIILFPSMSIIYIQRKYMVNFEVAKEIFIEWATRKGLVRNG